MFRISVKSAAASLLLISTLAGADPARAQEAPADASRAAAVQRLSDEGAAFYQQRDYRHANEKFQQAYQIDPDPNLLYNIAKCYEALGDKQTAIEKYELFINSPGADSQGRLKAHEAVRLLRAQSAPVAPAAAGGAAPSSDAQPGAAARPEPSHTNVPAIVSFVIGAAGLAVGGTFGGLALSKRSDLDTVCSNRQCPPQSKDDVTSLKTWSTVSTVGFIVGAAGVVAGGVFLFVLRPSKKETATGVHVSPFIGMSQAGLVGSF